MGTISQIGRKIKLFASTYTAELGVSAIIILVAFSSFYLGRASAGPGSGGITIESAPDISPVTTSAVENVEMTASANQALTSEPKDEVKGPTRPPAAEAAAVGQVVASKNGVRYYYLHCSGVSRLSEKNKIYFASAAEAESFGLTLAANCFAKQDR